MSRSKKRSLRITLLIIPLVCLGVVLPLFSTSGAAPGRQDDKYAKTPFSSPEAAAKQGEPEENPEFSTITIATGGKVLPKGQLQRPNVAQGAAVTNESEPNNTSATATPIVGASVKARGNVFPVNDVDFYSFSATAGDRIYAAVQTLFDASASGDSVLELISTDGTTVLETDNNDGTFNASSSSIAGFLIPSTGTFFLRVRHNTATGTIRPYDLYFTRQTGSPTPETESNNTTATANPLPASGWVSGTITAVSPGEADFYSLTLAAGDTVYLSLDMNPERDANVWNGRLGFGLFGNPPANQILIANDANAGATATDPNSEAFFFTVKDAGTYFVYVDSIVAAGLGATATYNLSVSVFPQAAPTGTCTTYTSTNVPQTIPSGPGMVTSTLTVPGNPRIEDLRVQINLNHTFMQDLDVHLVSPAGNDNGLFTDIGAATVGGPQTLMDVIIDDNAALPPAFALSASFHIQPEAAYRLGWFKGENAGGTWTLVIRDDATGDSGTLNSWSITVCEPPAAPTCTGTPVTAFSTDFESGAAGFTHSGTADEWELGTPATVATSTSPPVAGLSAANSGVNCWKTDLDNTYDISSSQDLFSPNIDLTTLLAPVTLTWAQWYQIETANFDHAAVTVEEVGGGGATQTVFQHLDATMTNAPGSPAVNIGESAGWGIRRADISSFAGKTIRIHFHLDSDTTVNLAGLAIDDVSVIACSVAAPCVLTCPANVTQTNDPDQCGAVVTYPPPTTTGDCGTVSCSPPSGSFFPVGTTTVTCTDTGGGSSAPKGGSTNAPNGGASCSFTVTVTDDQPPTITCPANITQSNDPNQCGAVVTYPPPTITDNCPGMFTATCNPPSGSFFPVGTTTVTCTVDGFANRPVGAPSGGNAQSGFAISSAGSSTNTGATNAAGAGISGSGLVTGKPAASFHLKARPKVPQFPQSPFALLYDQTDNPSDAGTSSQNFEAAFDSFDDFTADDFVVPAGEIWNIDQVNVSGVYFNGAGPATSVNVIFYPDSATLPGTAEATFNNVTMTDTAGNFVIMLPSAATLNAGTHWVSVQANQDFGTAGQWAWLDRITTSNSGAAWNNPGGGFASGCSPNYGRKTTCVTGSDPDNLFQLLGTSMPAGGGTGPTCQFTVTVNDTQPPVITCPANITVATATVTSPCQVVNFTTTASDNCPGVTVVCNPPSGSCFPVGVTTVTCTATDASGNTATCSFTVSVFNGRLEDDAEGCNDTVLFNTLTGDYRWCCHGTTFTGKAKVAKLGNTYTLTHNTADRRVIIQLSAGSFPPSGNASLQSPPGTVRCVLSDRDTRNDTCLCGSAPPPVAPPQ